MINIFACLVSPVSRVYLQLRASRTDARMVSHVNITFTYVYWCPFGITCQYHVYLWLRAPCTDARLVSQVTRVNITTPYKTECPTGQISTWDARPTHNPTPPRWVSGRGYNLCLSRSVGSHRRNTSASKRGWGGCVCVCEYLGLCDDVGVCARVCFPQ